MHTKGPWEADDRGMAGGARFSGYVHCDDSTGSAVALTRFQFVARSEEEALANARLIAAAPDYAKAAPDAADLLDQYADFIRRDVKADDLERHPYLPLIEQTAEDLRTAIARATGAGA